MSSYYTEANQQQPTAYFTPGWNDPPALAISTGQPVTPSQLLSQRKRRPLDPSVQQDLGQNFGNGSAGGYGSNSSNSYQQHLAGSPNYQPNPHQQPAMQQYNPHHQQQYNQPAVTNHNYDQPLQNQAVLGTAGQAIMQQPTFGQSAQHTPSSFMVAPQPQQLNTHPASAFTPMVPTSNLTNLGFQNEVSVAGGGRVPSSTLNSQPLAQAYATPASTQHFPASGNPHPVQIGGLSGASQPTFSHPQLQQPARQSSATTTIQREVAFQAFIPPTSNSSHTTNQMRNYEGEDPSSLIFSPPNTVSDGQHRPATQPDPNTYIAPTKAAGDVSLNGPQLGPMREGIQLKIGQLNDLVTVGQLSESCLKKLNFVVDAVDRGAYDEAWQFFEQLQINFPDEMSNGAKWTQGLKFLILELKKQKCNGGVYNNENQQQIRAGSASSRMM